ncbi:hypothetical protein [Neobacillus sp. 204]|uniref:hypothetical protein n=1 Tax=Neobacillus sp. 204 TaxID=3383351 RepID=UPI00397B0926
MIEKRRVLVPVTPRILSKIVRLLDRYKMKLPLNKTVYKSLHILGSLILFLIVLTAFVVEEGIQMLFLLTICMTVMGNSWLFHPFEFCETTDYGRTSVFSYETHSAAPSKEWFYQSILTH